MAYSPDGQINKEGADPHYPVSAETTGDKLCESDMELKAQMQPPLAKLRALTIARLLTAGQETAGQGGPPTYPGPDSRW
jgi:para-nitrobenzyl esterase